MISRVLAASVIVALSAGCAVEDEPSLRIQGAFVPDAECSEQDIDSTGTSFDVSVRSNALIGFRYASDEVGGELAVNGETLASPGRRDVIVDEVELRYENSAGINLETTVSPIYFYAQSAGEGFIILNIISPQAAQALSAALPDAGNNVDIVAGITFRGKKSASGETVKTREVRYPVSVYRSGNPGCTAPQIPELTGPCGTAGGQAGIPYTCVDPA